MKKPLTERELKRRAEIKKLTKYVKILTVRKSKKQHWRKVEKYGAFK